jgi:hypothetical protein
MGMDLVPRTRKRDVDSFHFNWTGWRQIGDLLDQLQCDTSEMDGGNDGRPISSATCKQWAKVLAKALKNGDIRNKTVLDDRYVGNSYTVWLVGGPEPLEADDIEYLKDFIRFLNNCGGCRQY